MDRRQMEINNRIQGYFAQLMTSLSEEVSLASYASIGTSNLYTPIFTAPYKGTVRVLVPSAGGAGSVTSYYRLLLDGVDVDGISVVSNTSRDWKPTFQAGQSVQIRSYATNNITTWPTPCKISYTLTVPAADIFKGGGLTYKSKYPNRYLRKEVA